MWVNRFAKWRINLFGKRFWIVEIKQRADCSVLGQVLLYEKLVREDWNCVVERKIVVAVTTDSYAPELLREHGIELLLL